MKRMIVLFTMILSHNVIAMGIVDQVKSMMTRDIIVETAKTQQLTAAPASQIVLDTAGNYLLSENAPEGILISADNVTINLHSFTVSNATGIGIEIASGVKNVIITSGLIANTFDEGIKINDGCKNIYIDQLELFNCGSSSGQFALNCDGTTEITNIKIFNVAINNSRNGIRFTDTSNSILERIKIANCSDENESFGINIFGSSDNNILSHCYIQNCSTTFNDGVSTAFSINANNTLLERCYAENIFSEGTGGNEVAQGFSLSGNCFLIDSCSTCTINAPTSTNPEISGFNLDNVSNSLMQNCYSFKSRNGMRTGGGTGITNLTIDNCIFGDNIENGLFTSDAFEDSLLQNCLAQGNGSDGFFLGSTAEDNVVFLCYAVANGEIGFNNDGSNNVFIDNIANQNGVNYAGVTNTSGLSDIVSLGDNADPVL